jgi:hypothetical protein
MEGKGLLNYYAFQDFIMVLPPSLNRNECAYGEESIDRSILYFSLQDHNLSLDDCKFMHILRKLFEI